MGYHYARNWKFGLIWEVQNSYSINLDNVLCTSPYWDSCTYSTTHNCNHYEDVFLSCWCPTPSCPPGQHRHSCSCRDCPVNTFKSNHGNETSCNPCPGSSSSDPGSTYCSCKAGTFWNVTQCQNCSQGLVSSYDSLQCVKCPTGSNATKYGTSCSCLDGMEWIWFGQSRGFCNFCPAGTYKNSQTKTCINCPTGLTSELGSNRCICPAGKFWNETVCQECPTGNASEMGATQCLSCPSGALNGTSCSCPKGHLWVWDALNPDQGSCQPCQPGTYKSSRITSSCDTCPPGSTSTAGSERCSCPAGMFWNGTICDPCPPGSVSQYGAIDCTSCPSGSVALLGGTTCSCSGGNAWEWNNGIYGSCQPCFAGTYKNSEVGSCVRCPSGYTSVTGSDHCLCDPGTFWNRTSCYNCTGSSVSNHGFLHCLLCPAGSTADPGKTSCSCPAGKTWRWDDLGNGACRSVYFSLVSGIVLVSVTCVLALLTLGLGIKFVLLKFKTRNSAKTPDISYIVSGGVVQYQNEGAEWRREDLDRGHTEPELYCVMNKAAQKMFRGNEAVSDDNVYNSLHKKS